MLKLHSFIGAIHAAILSANDALVDKNLEVLNTFFEDTTGEFEENLDDALKAINDVLDPGERTSRQVLRKALKALQDVKGNLSKQNADASGADSSRAFFPQTLRPKMIAMQYPHKTASGITMSEVQVPLITLAPLSMTQISEVKFSTQLEIQVEDDELAVSFPSRQSGTSNETDQKSNASSGGSVATLEITLTPHHGTDGLKKIVEGYEKVLRAQLPH